jgi:hypothetical protein
VKKQMLADYNMISARYNKLFQSLNKALETRVRELDRPAMQIAAIKKTLIFDKLKDNSALVMSTSGETVSAAQIALGGKLKQKTGQTMRTLSGSIAENESYSAKLEQMLFCGEGAGSSAAQTDFFFLPVIVSSTESTFGADEYIDTLYTAEAGSHTAPLISEVSRVQGDFAWEAASTNERELVKREFLALCEKENAELSDNARKSAEMVRLFEQSVWQVPHTGGGHDEL